MIRKKLVEEIKVVEILSEPTKQSMNLGDMIVEYWRISVVVNSKGLIHESSVTFTDYNDALKLVVGEVFYR